MRRLATGALAVLIVAVGVGAGSEEPFRSRGSCNSSVHRFFPDLDARLNAVRYGRWRALEIAWKEGITPALDERFSASLIRLLRKPPRFPPEADRVAPRFAREAVSVFRALRWGQVFEQQTLDVLASPDATPRLTSDRLQRLLDLYRRERWAISEPDEPVTPSRAVELAPSTARILIAGTQLFASASEDLVAGNFGEQRWRVKRTVADFDRNSAPERPPETGRYRTTAPTFSARYPGIADHLERLARFRLEVYDALVGGGEDPAARRERDNAVREVARRYRIPVEGIGGR